MPSPSGCVPDCDCFSCSYLIVVPGVGILFLRVFLVPRSDMLGILDSKLVVEYFA